jgi:SAM-dependent methyltransferase
MCYTKNAAGIYQPEMPIVHRDQEYHPSGFDMLVEMQERHFWYRGRHRFLFYAVNKYTRTAAAVSAVDVGGGVGGWIKYLADHAPGTFSKLALADSALSALEIAETVVPSRADRYQVDLMHLDWKNEWDIVFLLDVIEHLPDDIGAMHQAAKALKPGGYLFVTTPALNFFWSYNDEFAYHLRRYSKQDFAQLAETSGLRLREARYFMFLLSPLYWLSRRKHRVWLMTELQRRELYLKTHRLPPKLLNECLAGIFCFETPIGHKLSFPWGTSVLGVFQKPLSRRNQFENTRSIIVDDTLPAATSAVGRQRKWRGGRPLLMTGRAWGTCSRL